MKIEFRKSGSQETGVFGRVLIFKAWQYPWLPSRGVEVAMLHEK